MVDGWADRGWERTCAHARRSSVIISDAIDILHDSVRSKLPVYSFPSIAAVSQSATVQCRCCCVGAAAAFEGRPARRGLHGETLLLSGIDKGLLVLSSPLLSSPLRPPLRSQLSSPTGRETGRYICTFTFRGGFYFAAL